MTTRRPLKRTLALAWAAACLAVLGPALPARAADVLVELKNGKTMHADVVYYTYTDLVVIHGADDLTLVPNGEIKAVDGVPFEQAYWSQKPSSIEALEEQPAPTPAAAVDGAWPLKPGTLRRYNTSKSITTWVRRGTTLQRRTTEQATGTVVEAVDGLSGVGKVAVTETIRERLDGKAPHEVKLSHQIEPRPDGYYLMAQAMDDDALRTPHLADHISTPPRLWPNTFAVGQVWIVGPFERMGLNQVGRMHVVGRETVTVPAGTYPDAFKVTGYGHVFDGTQLLKGGRLVTDHGTLETTTWFVPGLGPVKEEAKLHIHQDYFPMAPAGTEIPLVVEETSTRSLAEYQLGR